MSKNSRPSFQMPQNKLGGWVLALLLLAVFAVGAFLYAANVRSEIDELATANSDSTQWSLAQTEVELLSFENAMMVAIADPTKNLADVRRQFDIFYSRVNTIQKSRQFSELRQMPDAASNVRTVQLFLDSAVPTIDADDATLRAALPDLLDQTRVLDASVRDLSLRGVETFAKQSDALRTRVARTLRQATSTTMGLIVVLLCLVFVLLRMVRASRARAVAQALSNSRLNAVVTTSLDAILVVDRHGKILVFNDAAEQVFGYSRSEVLGQPMVDMIIPESSKKAHTAGMKRYLETGEKRVIGKGRIALEAIRKDGTVFPVEASISSAQSQDGEVFVSYLRDVSARVEAQKELIETRDKAVAGEKAKADLLAVMSHEMRTPLNGLLGTLELIQDTDLTPKQRDYTAIMAKSGQLLLHHVNDVLDISRLDARKMEIADDSFDANAVIQDVLESQRPVAETHGNKLVRGPVDKTLSHVKGDPTRLRQVLLNLLGNAIKFTNNGVISIEAERLPNNDRVEFRVIDNGIGIGETDLARIFDDFVTLDTSYIRSAGGTGLGLGIVRRMTHAMGGKLGVESELGEGSLFWVRIPLAVLDTPLEHPTETEQSHDTVEMQKSMKILLVEDNQINRIVASEMLAKGGHRVTQAHDGREGVALAQKTRFDLILMDISMPEMDGVSATQIIRSGAGACRDVPIIALTAHALPDDIKRFSDAGMNDALIKPISKRKLTKILSQVHDTQSTPSAKGRFEPPKYELIVDQDALGTFRANLGAEKSMALISDFLTDTRTHMPRLMVDMHSDFDPDSLQQDVHRVAGSAGIFGAVRLRALLIDFESDLKSSEYGNIPRHQKELAAVWKETDIILSQEIGRE